MNWKKDIDLKQATFLVQHRMYEYVLARIEKGWGSLRCLTLGGSSGGGDLQPLKFPLSYGRGEDRCCEVRHLYCADAESASHTLLKRVQRAYPPPPHSPEWRR